MAMLTVTAKGQVTLRKEVLQHLGVGPGDQIEVDLSPEGQVSLRAVRRTGKISDINGFLKGKTNGAVLTIEEMNEVIERSWAGLE